MRKTRIKFSGVKLGCFRESALVVSNLHSKPKGFSGSSPAASYVQR